MGEYIPDGVLTLVVALAAVAAVLYLSYIFSRYLAAGAAKINRSKYVKIIDRVVLGQDRMMLIVMIGEKYYLVGSTSQSIQILTELEDKDIAPVHSEKFTGNADFKTTLRGLLSKKQGGFNE